MKIILGSSSKYRRAILQKHGYEFETMSPDIDEGTIRTDDHYKLPLLLARAKIDALIPKISEPALVITADAVVVCDGILHEKPRNEAEARLFLAKYSDGKPSETVSALVVINTVNNKRSEGVDIAKIYFRPLPNSVVEEFIKTSDPYSKAGAFAIELPIL